MYFIVDIGVRNASFPLFSTRYIVFSRYWTDLICIGIFPLFALILLNYGIYTKIRKVSYMKFSFGNLIFCKLGIIYIILGNNQITVAKRSTH